MKERLFAAVDRRADQFIQMADQLFDHPEPKFEEEFAASLLCGALFEAGFEVERPLGTLTTAFRATWRNGEGGPVIGLLAEYDALPMGHACGHQLQGPAMLSAAIALKETLGDLPCTLVVYGTPGEEGGAGKYLMLEQGYIKELDVALMVHGGPATQVDVKSMAMRSVEVTFKGKSAHAALKPDQGRSALDALLLCFHGLEFLREHVAEDTRIHYTVLDAGGPANVVPEKARGSFYLRSYNSAYLETVWQRFLKIVEGAALMTETTYDVYTEPRMNRQSKVPVHSLNELLMDNARLVGAPNIKGAREKTGSTDFGDVTYLLPGSCLRIAFVPEGSAAHSQAYLDAGKTKEAHDAIVYSAKIIAGTVYDLLSKPENLERINAEFLSIKQKMGKA